MMRLWTAIVCLFLLCGKLNSQSCLNTGLNGTTFNLACNQVCSTFVFQVPHLKSSDDYVLTTIPFSPLAWTTPGGVIDANLYQDDRYSSLQTLPFNFCFYGATYPSVVVGSNALITFDPGNAGCSNAYIIDAPIPNGTGTQCGGISPRYYPRASVMPAYSDVDPTASQSPPDRKIEWRVEGTAPCRKFVVSYWHVGTFGDGNYSAGGTNCNSTDPNNIMIVLYESTGLIEIFLGHKVCSSTTNSGRAIMGIQDWNRTKAVFDPARNNSVWTANGEGYRFTPNGATSRFVVAQLLDATGNVVATADTSTTTPGLLDLKFPNFCPGSGNNIYTLKTVFSACEDPNSQLISLDQIIFNRTNSLNATATTTASGCTAPSGSITVTVPAGVGTPPYTYILDGGTPVTGPSPYTFNNVTPGSHTIVVTDASAGCTSNINVTVTQSGTITAAYTTTPTACTGASNGSITVTSANGIGPYTFSLDGGPPQAGTIPFTFNVLSAGNHTFQVFDIGGGCTTGVVNVTVPVGPGVSGTATTTATSCAGVNNGTITVTATAGTAPFTWSLDGAPFVPGASPYTFTNVSAGSHNVTIKDNFNCTILVPVTVSTGTGISGSATSTATSCPGATNGTITVTANSGTAPFTCNNATDGRIRVTPLSGLAPYNYSLDGATPVTGTPPYTFTGLTAGTHTIQIFDAAGCVSTVYSVNIPAGPALTSSAFKTDVQCNGDATGSIIMTVPSGGVAPYEFSLDGINWQSGRNFSGLTAGAYTVRFRSSNGCTGQLNVTITEPPLLTAATSMTPAVCFGDANGLITATAAGGVPPYQYSIDGGITWDNSPYFNRPAGNYTIIIKDAHNCTSSSVITVTQPALLTASSANTDATCNGGSNGIINVNANGGNGFYMYSIDGVNYQSSNSFHVNPGNYTVYVKDKFSCSASFNTTVGLNFDLFLTPMTDPVICEGSSIRLNPSSNAMIYSWTPATALSNSGIPDPIANPVNTTNYYLTAVLGRCTLKDTITLFVNKAPLPDAGRDGDICYGQSYTLQGSGGTAFEWSPPTYLNSPVVANPVSTPTITTTYTLFVTDINGCSSLVSDEVKVNVTRIMSVKTIPFDTLAAPGELVQLMAFSPAVSFSWTPSIGLNNTGISNPVATAATTIGSEMMYQVTATNSEGCKGEGYVRIKIYEGPALYVPSGFSPNADGRNEKFQPKAVGIKAYHYFRVYDRWGQLMFSAKDPSQGWDGTLGGKEQPPGIYVWMIEAETVNGKLITKKGTVTLIR